MDYKILFIALVAFLIGRMSTKTYYIGYDENKYNKADIAILLKEGES